MDAPHLFCSNHFTWQHIPFSFRKHGCALIFHIMLTGCPLKSTAKYYIDLNMAMEKIDLSFVFFPIFVTSHYIKSDNWIISLLFAYHLFDWIFIYTRVSASHKTVFIFVWSMHSSSLILLSQFNIAECKCNSFFLSSTFNVKHTQKTI